MESSVPRDVLGNAIGVGDVIVYPGRSGAHMWMNCAIVVEIDSSSGRTSLKVTGVSESYSGKRTYYKASVNELSRVVILHPVHYSDTVKELVKLYKTNISE